MKKIPVAAGQIMTAAFPVFHVVNQGPGWALFILCFMKISPVSQNNFSAIITLLKASALPTEDITEVTKLFLLEEENRVLGAIGLESSGTEGLLRSLAVSTQSRGRGYGKKLVEFLESFAVQEGVQHLYLLTTTADRFFAVQGYTPISRDKVPQFVRQTSEFRSVCPSSAIVMIKDLKQIAVQDSHSNSANLRS